MSKKLSFYIVVSEPFSYDGQEPRRLLMATRSSEVRIISDYLWQLIQQEAFDQIPLAVYNDLAGIKCIVPANEPEIQTILNRNKQAALDDEELYYVIQPTASCQLGCGYCSQQHGPARMSSDTISLTLERLREKLRRGSYKRLRIGWFGAEPLSGYSSMEQATVKLIELAEEFGVGYSAKIVTNGLLLSRELTHKLLHELRITQAEITLDGSEEFHDERRHTKNGKPTYQKIITNLRAIAQDETLNKFKLSIRCNVDWSNYEGVSPLINELARLDLQKRISFYVAPIHSWGNKAGDDSLPKEKFAEMEVEWLAEMIELGYNVSLVPPQKQVVCLSMKPDAELVDAYGNVYNCTETSYLDAYTQENVFSLGNLRRGIKEEKKLLTLSFYDEVLASRYDCHACKMLPVCGGACPKEWQEGRVPCPSAKFNMKDRLLLHYVQDQLTTQLPNVST